MTEKHTPGPWLIETSNSWRRIGTGCGGGNVCCPVKQNDGHPDLYFRNGGSDGPDARLIASAPDLLAALRDAERHLIGMYRSMSPHANDGETNRFAENDACIKAIRAAIAKAEGRDA